MEMKRSLRGFAAAGSLFLAMFVAELAFAQKQGGILKMYDPDSHASMSIHEEATIVSERPMMGVFNNLVMFDQHVKQNSLESIVPDLATGWSWNEDGTELTLPLRQGVTWHDGKPFTEREIKNALVALSLPIKVKIATTTDSPKFQGLSPDNLINRLAAQGIHIEQSAEAREFREEIAKAIVTVYQSAGGGYPVHG
jgi:ABC-type transport system substrate-binding protein